MKFCIIIHFIIGIYMFSFSAVLPSTQINTGLIGRIGDYNQYINGARFS
jgi:hypothetical protein